jgi:hypothetical protein
MSQGSAESLLHILRGSRQQNRAAGRIPLGDGQMEFPGEVFNNGNVGRRSTVNERKVLA